MLADPALEARARAISLDLRCPVCQNQSIDDSNAPLARDLRLLVRERLKAGDSDAAVKQFIVARYGEFVLLSPPFAMHTLLLWLGPPLALLQTLVFLLVRRTPRSGWPWRGAPAHRLTDGGGSAARAADATAPLEATEVVDQRGLSRRRSMREPSAGR